MTVRRRVSGDRLARAIALAAPNRRPSLQEAMAESGGIGLAEIARKGGMESLQASLGAFDGDVRLGRILAKALSPLVARSGRPKGRKTGTETARWNLNMMSPELARLHQASIEGGDISLPFSQLTWLIPGQPHRDRFAEIVADAIEKAGEE